MVPKGVLTTLSCQPLDSNDTKAMPRPTRESMDCWKKLATETLNDALDSSKPQCFSKFHFDVGLAFVLCLNATTRTSWRGILSLHAIVFDQHPRDVHERLNHAFSKLTSEFLPLIRCTHTRTVSPLNRTYSCNPCYRAHNRHRTSRLLKAKAKARIGGIVSFMPHPFSVVCKHKPNLFSVF